MTTVPDTVAKYTAAFSEPDDGKRRELLRACFATDGVFAAPPAGVLEGRDALDAYIAGVQRQMPGTELVRTTGIDEHHGRLRFRGKALLPEGDVLIEAVEHVAELDGDGRISRMTVFLGPLPGRE